MEIKRLGTTKLTVKFNTKHTNWDDTQTDFIGIEGEARSRCYSFKIQDAEGINFISENVKMLFKERGSSKVYFSKAVWNPEEEIYYCDIPGNILQKTQIIDIQVCIEDGSTRILTPIITKHVLSSLMSGAAASSGNDIYIDFENLNDIQKIIDSEEERKKNELERIEDSKRIKEMLDTNLDSELNKKINKQGYQMPLSLLYANYKNNVWELGEINIIKEYASSPLRIDVEKSRGCPIDTLLVQFEEKPNTDPELAIFSSLFKGDYFIKKISPGKWKIYATGDSGTSWFIQRAYGQFYNYGQFTPDVKFLDELPDGVRQATVLKSKQYATKTELISNVNLLNAKIDEKNKDCVTKTEYAKDKKRLNSTIAREKKLETLAGLILDELRKQNPDLKPVNISNILKIEEDEE